MAKAINVVVSGNAAPLRQALGSAEGSLSNFSSNVKKYALPAAAALGAVAYAGYDFVKAAMADEAASAELARQLRVSTGATDAQIKSLERYITKTSMATGVTDDELRPAFAALTRGTKSVTESQRALTLAQNIAAATGKPLQAVSEALAKGYGGQMTALKRLSPEVAATIKDGGTMADVMTTLEKTFAGASDTAANTAAGRFKRFNVALDETKEAIGSQLMPVAEALAGVLTNTVMPAIDNVVSGIEEDGYAATFRRLFERGRDWIVNDGWPMLTEALSSNSKKLFNWITDNYPDWLKALAGFIATGANWIINTGYPMLVDKMKQLGDALVDWIKPRIAPALKALGELIGDIAKWAVTEALPKLIATALEWAAALTKWAFELAPEVLRGLAEFGWEMVKGLGDILKTLADKAADKAVDIGKAILRGIADGIKSAPGKLLDLAQWLGDKFLDALKGLFNNLIADPVNAGVRKGVNLLDSLLGPWINFGDPPDVVPRLARGGIVTGRTLAMVGEAGPEAIIPLRRGAEYGLGGRNTTFNVTVNAGVGDPREIGRVVVDAIKQYERTAGPVFAAA